jgi:hypothetical protein
VTKEDIKKIMGRLHGEKDGGSGGNKAAVERCVSSW